MSITKEIGLLIAEASDVDYDYSFGTNDIKCKQKAIDMNQKENEMVKDVLDALLERGHIYRQNDKLVEPWCLSDKQWIVKEINAARMRVIITECCSFFRSRITKLDDGTALTKTEDKTMPQWLPMSILHSKNNAFPELTTLSDVPIVRADGDIRTEPGYDAETGIFLTKEIPVRIPYRPTQQDANRALNILFDLIDEFSFASPNDKSVWLSGVLSILYRPLINGPIPLHLISASSSGSGKTLLVDLASAITQGKQVPRYAYNHKDTEMQKIIVSILKDSERAILLDNVADTIGNSSLEAVLTATTYKGRILGQNQMTETLNNHVVWWATGNNLNISNDLTRRTLLASLKPNSANPGYRRGPAPDRAWKFPSILKHVLRYREEYLSAALTIGCAYLMEGRPMISAQDINYPAWSEVVQASIIWAGGADPAVTTVNNTQNWEATALERLLHNWPVPVGEKVTSLQLVELAQYELAQGEEYHKRKKWHIALHEWCKEEGWTQVPPLRSLSLALKEVVEVYTKDAFSIRTDFGRNKDNIMKWWKV